MQRICDTALGLGSASPRLFNGKTCNRDIWYHRPKALTTVVHAIILENVAWNRDQKALDGGGAQQHPTLGHLESATAMELVTMWYEDRESVAVALHVLLWNISATAWLLM